ncbi:hypothetical protein BDA99DRAFT_543584 [Phascolomyces articulosus]|uniref:Uncharacterized protein n=1 Tax=Phascolomyces articulosus TaxID=60185 RepID=A0AAD5P7L0_9FUNG|nr:hypothetical protein BDA99DRAFT_543584 [Phascolomyces articulosus]
MIPFGSETVLEMQVARALDRHPSFIYPSHCLYTIIDFFLDTVSCKEMSRIGVHYRKEGIADLSRDTNDPLMSFKMFSHERELHLHMKTYFSFYLMFIYYDTQNKNYNHRLKRQQGHYFILDGYEEESPVIKEHVTKEETENHRKKEVEMIKENENIARKSTKITYELNDSFSKAYLSCIYTITLWSKAHQ